MVTQPPQGSRLGWIDLRIVDVIVAVVLAALALAAAASQSPHGLSPLTALSCVAATGSVAWRRRAPVSAALVAITALLMLSVLQGARANSQLYDEPVAVLLDFYLLGRAPVDRYGPAVLALCLVSGLVVFAVGAYETGSLAVATVLSGWTISVGLPFAAGRALTSRKTLTQQLKATAAELEREQEVSASRAASEERNRVARELHDVIAHNLSVMVIQTSAARRVISHDRQAARAALDVVESSGRDALVELRRIMGVVRRTDDELDGAAPGLAQLEALVTRTRAAGLAVELRTEGAAVPLSPGLDLVAYRVVQESLTNSLKHSGSSQAFVRVIFTEGGLELEISDTGLSPALGSHATSGSGQGLVGMRERVTLFGGELLAGPTGQGGFLVRARLPLAGVDP